jgi:hypothetical protein
MVGLGLGVRAEVREGVESWAGEGRSATEVRSSSVGPWRGTQRHVDNQEDKEEDDVWGPHVRGAKHTFHAPVSCRFDSSGM